MDTKSQISLTCLKPRQSGYPEKPRTLGEHIRRRRLDLGLFQKDVAERVGADTTSVWNWENGTAAPELRFMPAILEFLGYDPRPMAKTVGEQLVRHRDGLGWSQKRLATALRVDATTLSRWELSKRAPRGVYAERVRAFLVLAHGTGYVGC